MVGTLPYLPDVMQGVVARVNTNFSTRGADPFNVYFAKGIHTQAARDLYASPNNYPLVWLVMNYPEVRGKDPTIYGEITAMLFLLAPTTAEYTQQQRDDLVFKPRLLPLYANLMDEIAAEPAFQFRGSAAIDHTRQVRPYWGGGGINGIDTPNLFEKNVDAITIVNLKLRMGFGCLNASTY